MARTTSGARVIGRVHIDPRKGARGVAWRARWAGLDGNRRTHSFSPTRHANPEKLAENFALLKTRDLEQGRDTEPEMLLGLIAAKREDLTRTLAEWIEIWATEHPTLKPRTRRNYRLSMNQYVTRALPVRDEAGQPVGSKTIDLGAIRLNEIRQEHIQIWLRSVRHMRKRNGDKISDATTNTALRILKACLQRAVERGKIDVSPAAYIHAVEEYNRRQPRPFNDEAEFFAFLIQVRPEWRVGMLLGAYAGLRWGEMAALTRADLVLAPNRGQAFVRINKQLQEFDGGRDFTTVKRSESERLIPLAPVAVEWLTGYLAEFPGSDTDPLMQTRTGTAVWYSGYRSEFNEALTRAGMVDSELTIHSLRHSFARFCIQNGVSLNELKELMGHTDITTTMKYVSISSDHLQKTINRAFTNLVIPAELMPGYELEVSQNSA